MSRNKLPRVLVISHNCFSLTGSNGRTLRNFFIGYPSEKLAQLYIVAETPDYSICQNYYQVTDKDVLLASLKRKNAGSVQSVGQSGTGIEPSHATNFANTQRIHKMTSALVARELLWANPLWRKSSLMEWITAFHPDIVLFQAGNLGFLCDLSREIALKCGSRLVVYNSEGYYFKKYDYIRQTTSSNIPFAIYKAIFCRKYSCMMTGTSLGIYNSEELCKAYQEAFSNPGCFIMSGTENRPIECKAGQGDDVLTFAYLGNLGLGRDQSLMEIAKTLQKIDHRYRVRVYGRATEETIERFKRCSAIEYCGFVSYDDTLKIINSTDVNIHVEGFDPFYVEDTKYGFSTKVADLLASGKCMLLYAPSSVTVTKYIQDNQCGCVVTSPEELHQKLSGLVENEEMRRQYAQRAALLAKKNHDVDNNRSKFQKLLVEVFQDASATD